MIFDLTKGRLYQLKRLDNYYSMSNNGTMIFVEPADIVKVLKVFQLGGKGLTYVRYRRAEKFYDAIRARLKKKVFEKEFQEFTQNAEEYVKKPKLPEIEIKS